ncbi:aromatic ring-hydroxylating oxygenase subunit alpha [Azospirillum halopraeferens]|uniref:aromatic ring-hydroxylating oxygenase subunit alpha n=1 Tax=Azospirillum halopraeferens TaxID=34010 RepID=UPI000410FBA4|nr:aromatic ring-hydroxylating dioxygenase subunit alpha [Azospirillum halopraeferens]
MVDESEPAVPVVLPERIIPPRAYHDPAVHRDEVTRLFRRSWLFAGFTDDLRDDDDFITAELAGTSVVVQNFRGALRALHNVCSHRFARLQTAACGNRRLVCPYHGWLYNADGVPVGIPGNDEHFGFDRERRRALALDRFEVAVRGRFVFVRLEPGGAGLDEHLGAYGPLLDHVSAAFPDRFDDQTVPWAADWKIGVESVLEVYHVASVHPETFKPFFRGTWDIESQPPHSRGVAALSDTGVRYWNGIVRHLGLRTTDRHRDYDNITIFPNLALGITHGAMLSVQTYDPVAPGRCDLRFRLFLAAAERRDGPVRRHVEDSLRAINLRVLEEDRAVSETVQRGIVQARRPAVPGRNEARIHTFHAAWLDRMDRDDYSIMG